MSDGRVYSERLGAIRDEQFAAAVARLGLGTFLHAEPTTAGLFGQNVFLSTSTGEYVLRGAPHWVKGIDDAEFWRDDRWQFTKETWFARQLHERTRAPVPWPFLHEQSDDVFGWPFIIMQRTPGHCFNEREILEALGPEDRREIAVALGVNLVEMQRLTSPFAGDFNPRTIVLEPYPAGYVDWVIREIAAMTKAPDGVTDEDRRWIAEAVATAHADGDPSTFTLVHGDYKLNNLTVEKESGGWRVSGVFDLHEVRYGDGALDIVRQACSYLDTEPALAAVFLAAYRERLPHDPQLKARLPLYILNDRLKFWIFFTRPGQRAAWTEGRTFKRWAARYVDKLMALL